MTEIQQRTLLVGSNDSGDYEYLETYVPFDGDNYHEWIAEILPENQFRLWRQHGFPETGVVHYRPDVECSGEELTRAGYADVPQVRHPDTPR